MGQSFVFVFFRGSESGGGDPRFWFYGCPGRSLTPPVSRSPVCTPDILPPLSEKQKSVRVSQGARDRTIRTKQVRDWDGYTQVPLTTTPVLHSGLDEVGCLSVSVQRYGVECRCRP